jgi:8-oxo-dGTP pyrophosphatase MutT (NUDIX family)
MSVATPRPAATVVVLRDSRHRAGFEVLMVRRNDTVAFMAGAYVFPGGRLDDADLAHAQAVRSTTAGPSRFPELTPEGEWSYRLAAARELQEEAGVRLDPADLVPFAHWVTPESETRRYDTRFFLARMPPGQEAAHDQGETTELSWLRADEAISRGRGGEIMLPPPTWTTLKRLARFASADDVFDWARRTPIPTVQPTLVRDEQQTMLTLPGDPTFPTIAGWEIPEDTRFLLQDGRWQPVKL